MAATINISVLADTRRAQSGLSNLNKGLQGSSRFAGKFGKALALGVAGGAAAFVALGNEAVKSLANIERINAQTAQTIKSTGGAAGVTTKHIAALSDRLEKMTATEAEATQEGANMLLTFTNIRNGVGKGNKVFDQATTTLVDMTRALGSDPQKQAVQLGKALNDPVKGVSALSKVGVSFTDGQKKTIAALVKTGDTMGAQKVILKELNKEFGGSGKAYAKTAAGQAELAKAAFGDLTEMVFAKVLPVLGKLATFAIKALTKLQDYGPQIQKVMDKAGAAFKAAGKKIQSAFKFIQDNAETFKIIGAAIAGAVAAFVLLGTAVKIYTAIQLALNIVMSANPVVLVVLAIGALIGVMVLLYQKNETVRLALQKVFAYLQREVPPILVALRELFLATFERIKQIVATVTAVIQALWAKFGTYIVSYLRTSFNNLKLIVRGALNIIKGVIKTVTALIKGDWKGVWDGIKQILSGAWSVIKGIVKQGINVAKTAIRVGWEAVKTLTSKAWKGIKEAVRDAITGLVHLVESIPGKVKRAIGDLGQLLFNAGKAIIQGLIDGIDSMIGSVTKKLKKLTNLIPDVKGPYSRDKVLLYKNGRAIIQSLINGFAKEEKGVVAKLKNLTNVIAYYFTKRFKGQKDATGKAKKATKTFLHSLADEYAALRRNARLRESIAKRLDKAEATLAARRKQRDEYASNISKSAQGSITGLNTAFNSEAMVAALKDRVAKIKQYNALLKDLIKKGLRKDLVDQLAQAGVEGGLATATAIAAGGTGAIKDFNTVQRELVKAGNELGTTTANSMYGAGIRSSTNLVKGIKSQQKKAEAEMRRLGRALAKALSEGLGGVTVATAGGANRPVNKTYNVNVRVDNTDSPEQMGKKIKRALDAYERAGGK